MNILWHCPSLGLKWKRTFSSPVATPEFSKFAGIMSVPLQQNHLFRIWNSSTRITLLPPALSVRMLLRLTLLHIPGYLALVSEPPSWLSRSLRPFMHSSSVYSCHLFLISSAVVRSLHFLSFIIPIYAWNIPLVSPIFLKRSLVFPILLFPSISFNCSLRKTSLFLLTIL